MNWLLFFGTFIISSPQPVQPPPQHVLDSLETAWTRYYLQQRDPACAEEAKSLIESFDQIHGDNPYYLYFKSQTLGYLGDYEASLEIMYALPVEFLADPIALINRAARENREGNYETTLWCLQYASGTGNWLFEAFFHETLAQGYFPKLDPVKADPRARDFLYALGDPFYPVIARHSSAMIAAVDYIHFHNEQAIKPFVAQTFDLHHGRSPRYALLVADHLQKEDPEAAFLLRESLLKRLTSLDLTQSPKSENNQDGFSPDERALLRFWTANTAYKQAQALKTKDEDQYLQFMELAARFGPDELDSRISDSTYFYEKNILGVKDSYRTDYARLLEERGQMRRAFDVWLDAWAVRNELLPEVKRVFQELYPERDFESNIGQFISTRLPDVPGFQLTRLDGSLVSKDSYKGKWLLLDFWGTWCSPCRAEIPAIQALYQELKAKAGDQFELLAVAINDREPGLRRFIKKEKMTYPVAIGEMEIAKAFGVSVYPTKFLVDPEGKMLTLSDDWESVVSEKVVGDGESKVP